MLPEIPMMSPPGAPRHEKDMTIPSALGIRDEYSAHRKQQRRSKPSFISVPENAARDAMKTMRGINGTKPKAEDIVLYERMGMEDFEAMRKTHGSEAVENFVKDMEYKRLGGR